MFTQRRRDLFSFSPVAKTEDSLGQALGNHSPPDCGIEIFKSLFRIKKKLIRVDEFLFYGGEGGI